MKAEQFEVHDPDKAMTRFQSLLGKLAGVPKGMVEAKRKPKGKAARKKRKA
ncbi:MAG TPA: hypothetical protein VGW33_00315 [Terriglobia bacterium]|nr:hypothetical protein [Terriglobia bacterium]